MKILVTGHTGFVGNAVASAIEAAEHEVIGVSRTIDQALGCQQISKSFADLTSGELDSMALDAVIHCAWIATPGVYLQSDKNETYARESLSFLKKCVEIDLPRFVGVGSCAELVQALDSPYSRAKSDFRIVGQQLTADTCTHLDWAYIFYPYGPNEHQDCLSSSLIRSLQNSGSFTLQNPNASKDYIYIDDVAHAVLAIVTRSSVDSGEFQIGSGQPVTIEQIARAIAEILQLPSSAIQKSSDSKGDPIGDVVADIRSLHAVGWTPQTSLESGLKKLYTAITTQKLCKS